MRLTHRRIGSEHGAGGSRPRHGECVQVELFWFPHTSLFRGSHQLEPFQSKLDVIQPRNSVPSVLRVFEFDRSLQVRPITWRRARWVDSEFGGVESGLGEEGNDFALCCSQR